jgi:hypothetical protein
LAARHGIAARADIYSKQIGIIGVSPGGWIGPLAASCSKDIAFVISVSGSAVTPAEETLDYMQSELKINEAPGNEIQQAVSLTKLA